MLIATVNFTFLLFIFLSWIVLIICLQTRISMNFFASGTRQSEPVSGSKYLIFLRYRNAEQSSGE